MEDADDATLYDGVLGSFPEIGKIKAVGQPESNITAVGEGL